MANKINVIRYRTTAHPGLPTEHHATIVGQGMSVYDPQQFLTYCTARWPQLLFKLEQI